MEHGYYKELLQLSIYDEISVVEKERLDNHLCECSECNAEYEQLKNLYSAMNSNQPGTPSDFVLLRARTDLMRKIEQEKKKLLFFARLTGYFTVFNSSGIKYALSGTATLVMGFVLGYFYYLNVPQAGMTGLPGVNVDNKTSEEVEISNIRFDNPFTNNGEIEITYDAIKPITYRGSMEDEKVRELLSQALISSKNPGFKLKTLNTMSLQNDKKFIPDVKVKSALIKTIKTDGNPGVRREAMNLLAKFPYDEEIVDILIFAMSNDDNSGIRVAAINLLADYTPEGKSIDSELKKVLENKAQSETNDFIKLRAASLIKEVK